VSEYTLRRSVRYYELDAAGIVHFSWYFRYLEEAEHALWRSAGLSIAPQGSEVEFPRVAASFEFHHPLKFEEEFDVHIRVEALTEKSITYRAVLTRGETLIATGTTTAVCVKMPPDEPMRAVPIPVEIANKFAVAEDARL
jgi:YbgC/YbaW family acyl-CoA thioester hydrolase